MSTETSQTIRLASVKDIPEGEGREYRVGDLFVAIFRDQGEFYALEDYCPHAGAPLNDGPVSQGAVTCMWHGWKFSLRDGSCMNIPRGFPVRTFPLNIVGEDIYVTLPTNDANAENN